MVKEAEIKEKDGTEKEREGDHFRSIIPSNLTITVKEKTKLKMSFFRHLTIFIE